MTETETFDEMWGRGDSPRAPYLKIEAWYTRQDPARLRRKQRIAANLRRLADLGSGRTGTAPPFDPIPRILSAADWTRLEAGVKQRATALNRFLADIHGPAEILQAGILPEALVARLPVLEAARNIIPPGGLYTHLLALDLVRTGEDAFHVLEDTTATPTGLRAMLDSRDRLLQLFPDLFATHKVRPITATTGLLRRALASAAPAGVSNPVIALWSLGPDDPDFREHAVLADRMGIELVRTSDLAVIDGRLTMRTTLGPRPIDVLFRGMDEDEMTLPGADSGADILDVYRAGRLGIANAPGADLAENRALAAYMPDLIRFYLGETALLPTVPTWRCDDPQALAHVLDNLPDLVLKNVLTTGPRSLILGPDTGKRDLARLERRIRSAPWAWIAQPMLELSTAPVLGRSGLAARHVDLRLFAILSPGEIRVLPGGLTRVAPRHRAQANDTSQGQATKDTWVLEGDA